MREREIFCTFTRCTQRNNSEHTRGEIPEREIGEREEREIEREREGERDDVVDECDEGC